MNRISINLLPHREMRRERRKKDFIGLIGMVAVLGIATAGSIGFGINSQIDAQLERNAFITKKNTELDSKIAEISSLEQEIKSLQERQGAVESLQSNRTIPVHMFDELVKHVPEGVFLTKLTQDDKKISMVGQAQTNERIADFLRNLASRTPWMEKPELSKIALVKVRGKGRTQDEERQLFEFSLNAIIKAPADEASDQTDAPRASGPKAVARR
ncbi:MAG: PilN domain-containing protein [Burkholderiaceae bacterium]